MADFQSAHDRTVAFENASGSGGAIADPEQAKKEYWDPLQLGQIEDQDVASKLFDMAVTMGVQQAAVFAQRAANGHDSKLTEDGVIGEKTLAAINSLDREKYLATLREMQAGLYRHVASINADRAPNLEGWLRRAGA